MWLARPQSFESSNSSCRPRTGSPSSTRRTRRRPTECGSSMNLPFIFDTHRKDGRYVAPTQVRRFGETCRDLGLLPLPYSGCFFKDNLHVYSFSGPVRGFDVVAAGQSVASVERTLRNRVAAIWPRVPHELIPAQRRLLEAKRRVRHAADLETLRVRWRERLTKRP